MSTRMKDVIAIAESMGYKVEAKITQEQAGTRIRVTKITDKRGVSTSFNPKKTLGNETIRKITGIKLSKKSLKSRRTTTQKLHKAKVKGHYHGTAGLAKLTKDEIRRIKKFNRHMIKQGRPERMTQRRYRKLKSTVGAEEANRTMTNTELHYAGIAYPGNVAATATTIHNLFIIYGLKSQAANKLFLLLDYRQEEYATDKRFKDASLVKLNTMIYELQKIISGMSRNDAKVIIQESDAALLLEVEKGTI